MRRVLELLAIAALTVGVVDPVVNEADAAEPPIHTITVAGADVVGTYPELAPGITRYAINTRAGAEGELDGSINVTATTSDSNGTVRIDGRPVSNGAATPVDDLDPGDEVHVSITDQAGTVSRSFIYLPSRFPRLEAITSEGAAPGHVFLNLANIFEGSFEAVVDQHGVPVYVRQGSANDLKAAAGRPGTYSVARQTPPGWTIHELSPQFDVVRSARIAGDPASTDFHDSQWLPDGRVLLMGYQGNQHDGQLWLDAVIQIQDAGDVAFHWNSFDHVAPAEAVTLGGAGIDYAHVNSLEMQPNGDVVASFRNLSQVMRIATVAHDGYEPGDVVWRFGGKRNDFDILDDPYGGPCAQHTASILPNGNLVLFDNGSKQVPGNGQTGALCPDPEGGEARVERPFTRVTEYELDTDRLTARLVWSHRADDVVSDQRVARYSQFAGSSQRLPDGNTFIGWSSVTDRQGQPIATEVTEDGSEVWRLSAPGFSSYRAYKFSAPDAIAPDVVASPVLSATAVREGDRVPADYSCTDRGGSNLLGCSGPLVHGDLLDTTFGTRSFRVTATDRAGNRTSEDLGYAVGRSPLQPELRVRLGRAAWRGTTYWGRGPGDHTQPVTFDRRGVTKTVTLLLRNRGTGADRLVLAGGRGARGVTIGYRYARRNVTSEVVSGRFRTPLLKAGTEVRLQMVVRRTWRAPGGIDRAVGVGVRSAGDVTRDDRIDVRVRTR